jgi:hypothetical protein
MSWMSIATRAAERAWRERYGFSGSSVMVKVGSVRTSSLGAAEKPEQSIAEHWFRITSARLAKHGQRQST